MNNTIMNQNESNELSTEAESTMKLTFYDEDVWHHFVAPDEVVEMRILKATGRFPSGEYFRRQTISGYFDDYTSFRKALAMIENFEYSGAYFTLHMIDPRLIGRAFNRLKISDLTTNDSNILYYNWLPLDFDPVRPAGISSSDSELKEALALRDHVVPVIMERYGFDPPILAMSGNGCHALFRLNDWPAVEEYRNYVKGTIGAISDEFSTDRVNIDKSVWNPARIWKLYGTQSRKGDPVPAGKFREARPHRESYIESLGYTFD
ncbi:MAG: hypothetical protein RBR35_09970 [Salinivirgaceae bacterium]|nr:hypothetical protein [Salinivirgaceae bacterium]